MVFCVFVFAVARESPSRLRITVLSTTVVRTHKYTITLSIRQVAPEITLKDRDAIFLEIIKAHFEAEEDPVYRKMKIRRCLDTHGLQLNCLHTSLLGITVLAKNAMAANQKNMPTRSQRMAIFVYDRNEEKNPYWTSSRITCVLSAEKGLALTKLMKRSLNSID